MGVLVGKKAPDFTAKSVVKGRVETLSSAAFRGHYVLLFFYPLDFTFVCPTELHAFQEKMEDFEKRGVKILGCSVDSHYSHAAWLRVPREKGGIEGIEYPLISDINKSIAKSFGVLKEEEGIAYRGLFLIDKEGIVRHQVVNDLFLGRSVEEALRVVDALIFHEKQGEVCPANWQMGRKAMRATQEGLVEYYSAT